MTTAEQLYLPWMYKKCPSFIGSCPAPLILWTVSLNVAATVPPTLLSMCPGSHCFHAAFMEECSTHWDITFHIRFALLTWLHRLLTSVRQRKSTSWLIRKSLSFSIFRVSMCCNWEQKSKPPTFWRRRRIVFWVCIGDDHQSDLSPGVFTLYAVPGGYQLFGPPHTAVGDVVWV